MQVEKYPAGDETIKMKGKVKGRRSRTMKRERKEKHVHRRSRQGCLTCKLRKKRCDEQKPVCGDCQRLHRRCEYITEDMSTDQAEKLKHEMEIIEKGSKLRRRKHKNRAESDSLASGSSSEHNSSLKRNCGNRKPKRAVKDKKRKLKRTKKDNSGSKDVVFNPLSIDIAPIVGRNWLQDMGSSSLGNLEASMTQKGPDVSDGVKRNNAVAEEGGNENKQEDNETGNAETPNMGSIASQSGTNTQINQMETILGPNYTQYDTPGVPTGSLFSENYSNGFGSGQTFSSFSPQINPQVENQPLPSKQTELLSLEEPELNSMGSYDTYVGAFSPEFTKALVEHFQEASSKNQDGFRGGMMGESFGSAAAVNSLKGIFELSGEARISGRGENEKKEAEKTGDSKIEAEKMDVISTKNSEASPLSLFSSNRMNETFSTIYINPSIVRGTTLASLSPIGKKLYEYYRDKLSLIASSAPKEENMYHHTFLPMAHVDRCVLYGILAWSAFHLGGARMEKQGAYYIQRAIEGFSQRPVMEADTLEYYKDLASVIDVSDPDITVEKADGDLQYEFQREQILSALSKDDTINMRLAAFLILCGVEICRGDVTRWSKYLEYGARLIRYKGGLQKFNNSKDEHFLATNYAYHDITAVAVSKVRPLHFDLKEYEQMWTASNTLEFLDPLHNISSPIYNILAEINKLVSTSRRLYRKISKARSLGDEPVDESDDDEFLAHAAEELAGAADSSPHVSSETSSSNVYSSVGLSPEMIKFNKEIAAQRKKLRRDSEQSLKNCLGLKEGPNDAEKTGEDDAEESEGDELDSEMSIYEKYEKIMYQCQDLEARLNDAKPRQHILAKLNAHDLELQLTVFECFQLTAKIHLRQSVLRMTPSSLEIQYLENQLIKSLDVLLGTDVEAALCFPMFIAGMNVIFPRDRKQMNQRYNDFIKRYRWKNVLRCQIVMKQLWRLNPLGDRFVDWYDLVERLGWKLSFA